MMGTGGFGWEGEGVTSGSPWSGQVGESDDLGQVFVECWKVVGHQVAPVVVVTTW